MTTITKERLLTIKQWRETYGPGSNVVLPAEEAEELARIALASLEAEPVAWMRDDADGREYNARNEFSGGGGGVPLYATPPAPVVPEEKPMPNPLSMYAVDAVAAIAEVRGWNDCRAAMLQSGNFRENKNSSTNNFREIAETSTNYPVIPSEVLSAIQKVAKIRADFDDFDGDRRGIGDCLDEAEQELIVTINKYASQLAAEPIAPNDVREQTAIPQVPVWETSKSTSIGDIRRADSNYYRAVTAGKTGTLRPSHTEGTSWDGWGGSGDDDTGIEWEYLHSGFGIARITAVNGTTATAEVISYIPSQVVGEDNASYKWAKYAWNSVNGYPGTVVYYQQRLYFAASTAFPQTIWASRTGDYNDFGKSNPTQDDDRIIYTYAGRQVNEIRHLIDVGSLVALTSGGEYVITGDQNKVLTPSSFAFSSQGSNGSSNVPPIAVANIALFVQEKGSVVRDLAYSFDVDGYQGNDLTILANHLFQKHSIVDWCFSIVPYSSAFCIRDDGKLLVMTYLRDQQVFAWAPQSSTGKYESTCSISEGNEDAVYFVVNRTVNGQRVRYIERLSSRLFTSDEDAFFVDSGLSYDGRNTSDRTMTITGGSGEWDYRAEYTISVSGGAYFTSSDVGAQLQFPYTGAGPDTGYEVSKELRCDIISVTSNTAVVVRANRNVPPSLRNVATTNWQMARRTFGGLSHLEGQTVNILSDANVEPQKEVSGGAVTLESPGAVVHIGLPITAEFETLDININGQETLLDKKQVIPSVTLVVNASRGIWATTPGGKWYEYPQREFEFYDDPVDDATGKVEVKLDSNWGKNGRVKIRQLDPLPLSVLAVIPRLTVGGF